MKTMTAKSWTMVLSVCLGMWSMAVGCGPGKAATGSMSISLNIQKAEPLKVGDWTINLSKALLHLESVEALGGENVTQHSHDQPSPNSPNTSGGLKVVGEHKILDLLQKSIELVKSTSATAGEYTLLAMSFANAEDGESKGFVLWLEGTAEKGTEKRSFVVQWAVEKTLTDFVEFKSDIDVAIGGSVTVAVNLDVATLLTGIDWLTAKADAGKITINASNNSDILGKIQENLKKAFTLSK